MLMKHSSLERANEGVRHPSGTPVQRVTHVPCGHLTWTSLTTHVQMLTVQRAELKSHALCQAPFTLASPFRATHHSRGLLMGLTEGRQCDLFTDMGFRRAHV